MPLPGAHSRVHVWPDVWLTESHEPWMAMKRVLGPQQGATRCSQSIRKWPSPLSLPRLVHGKLPSSLAPLPRSFPPPWAAQSGQSPAQCEFQTARPASQCPVPSAQCPVPAGPVLTSSSVHSWVQAHLACGGLAAWNIPTPTSTVTSKPPSLTFLTPSIHQRLAARTLLQPIRIETRRQQLQLPAPAPSTGTICCQY